MATVSKKIFIEGSFFIAFIDRGNLNYSKAVECLGFIAHNKYKVYTLSSVILQTVVSIERDLGITMANEFLRAILESNIEILYIGKSDFQAALRYLKVNPSQTSYFSTIVKSIIMQKNYINTVLTFDLWPNIMGTSVSSLITT